MVSFLNIGIDSNSALFVFLLISTLALLITLIRAKTRPATKKRLNLPPGSFGWPILGETLDFLRASLDGEPQRFVKDRMKKHKSDVVFKTSLLGEPMAVLCGPAGNKFLFGNENKLVSVWWPSSVRRLLGHCLVTTVGEEAKQMRKVMSYFVSPDAMTRLYINTMDMVTQKHIKTHWQGKQEVKVSPIIKLYTFELACRLFMSLDDQDQIAELSVLFNIFLKGVIAIPFNFPGTRYSRAIKATNAIRKQLLAIVRRRRLSLANGEASASQDLLSHLLVCPDENGKFMAESDIVNNILLLLFAGHDTSSVTITLLMKTLAEFPVIYNKVLEEQREIASSKGPEEFLQWDDIQKMRYSWNVVSETIRMTPPVIGAYRQAMVDLSYGGYDIPKGWKLYWNAALTQTDPNLFPDPMKFDPSRFEGAGPAPYTYVTFGGGPRMCLGKEFARLEILVFLHNIVKKFRWKLQIPDEKIVFDPMAIPVEGLPILLESH